MARGVMNRTLIVELNSLEWFKEIMFFMDITIREYRPAVTDRYVIIRYVCGEKKQNKMMIASAKMFRKMRLRA